MGRNSSSPDSFDGNGSAGGANDPGFHSIRDRFPFKRNPNPSIQRDKVKAFSDRPFRGRSHHGRFHRKGLLWSFPFRGKSVLYLVIIFVVFLFAMASMVMQSSITSVFRQGSDRGRLLRDGLKFGSTLRFVPGRIARRFAEGNGLDRVRNRTRFAVRAPRLALILGNMKKDPQSLLLITVVKNIQKLGYALKIFAVENGKARSMWEHLGGHISTFGSEGYDNVDWSIYEGIIVDSLEAKEAITSLMQEPFCSVPLIWIIQEDTLANRLPAYEEMGLMHLISHWKFAFSRANVIVFPDFSLPMLHSVLDSGNFFVIPGSPMDAWAAESYIKTHSKFQLRKDHGFNEDDLLVLVVGSSNFYDELAWDYAVAMHSIGPLLIKYARRKDSGDSFKFVFLCGNTTDGYDDVLQEVSSRLGLQQGSLRHYGLNGDVNGVLLMADIILYDSSQDVQGFPPLLIRAMTFGIPVIAPDFPVLLQYVQDGIHGIFFSKHNSDALMKAFSLLISNGKLSRFAQTIASSGRRLAKNMLASECIRGYARLLENALNFPSDSLLPGPISELRQEAWEWNLFQKEIESTRGEMLNIDESSSSLKNSVVYALEDKLTSLANLKNTSEDGTTNLEQDIPSQEDWDILEEIETSEEYERLEMEELNERMERNSGVWDEIYRNARKSEKLKFEANERDEGELERTGQPVCIYEIYSGAAAWPFLHHGSLYRGLSLSSGARRLRSDDVNAVGRLHILNETFYRDILCEIGGLFAIARKVDNIHGRPWIGFQSWRAAGRKVSLSTRAEKVLEETIQGNTKGEVIYFWARLNTDGGMMGSKNALTFWSTCDILNGGYCRTAFEDAFRRMYGLPANIEALPPMPEDGGHWSALHSWVMPTPSFLEFVMFSRMFVDSLDALHANGSGKNMCLLGSSDLERKHCYCRVLEVLVNVWAYHSARKMVYIDPQSGSLEEQHSIEQRKGFMWAKYFNITLLKRMDEDLAEAADDGDHPSEMWLWPLTGEVHWQGIYEREREERYRLKMDKKRKTREKLFERMKYGYKQKSLGR
ncbi:hypothetical protein UlMin_026067 [Ulmus minor]